MSRVNIAVSIMDQRRVDELLAQWSVGMADGVDSLSLPGLPTADATAAVDGTATRRDLPVAFLAELDRHGIPYSLLA